MIYTITLSPALDKTIHLNTFNKNKLNIAESTNVDPGGKGINTAKVLNALGSDVTSIAFLGGATGRLIEEMLEYKDINQRNIYIEGETRTNIKLVESESCTELNEKATELTAKSLCNFEKIFDDIIMDASIITLAGRLPDKLDSNFYAKYIKKAKDADVSVVLDTSGESFKKGVLAKPWCIKPNIDELSEYFGVNLENDDEIILKCRELNQLGVEIVIVTLGPDGVLCTTSEEIIKVRAPKVTVKSTVGAGDSFVAGFLHKISQNSTIKDALKFATAVATAKVTLSGTNAPNVTEIEKYYKELD